jgi:hypothetical protein
MATFFGGETLIRAIRVNGSTNANTTVYTVPTGTYAIVSMGSFVSGGANTDVDVGAMRIIAGPNIVAEKAKEYVLFEGQTVFLTVNTSASPNSTWDFVVREYSIP